MKNIFVRWFSDLGLAFRQEWRRMMGDAGVMIFFLALPLAYPLVYTLIYNPEIITELPIAVVDSSRTEASRSLVRITDASPSIAIYDYCADMGEARRLFAEGKVFGVMEIPGDYSSDIACGIQTTVPFYADMSLLLRYRTFVAALTDIQLEVAKKTTATRVAAMGASSLGITGLPIENNNHFIGDSSQGFASFVMPGILILILQQSMVIGICMLMGTARERRRPLLTSASATVWGRALCYTLLYVPLTIYAIRIVPGIFDLPHIGSAVDAMLFMFPMLIASAMFGQTLGGLCSERESSFIVVVFTSVLFLFLSGLTWPRYAMSDIFVWLGNLIPSTWGIDGFIRINSNGAGMGECAEAYIALWVLTIIFSFSAIWITKKTAR